MATGFHGFHVHHRHDLPARLPDARLSRASSRRASISASNSPPGTGTSSTWSGCSCSPASTSGAPGARAARRATRRLGRHRELGSRIAAASERRHLSARVRDPARRRSSRLTDEYPPNLRRLGRACGRCPRCGNGHLFPASSTLAPRCDVCGLDFAFADAGDGPAVFVTLHRRHRRGGARAVGRGRLRAADLGRISSIFLPLTLSSCLGDAAAAQGPAGRAAIPQQGRTGPARAVSAGAAAARAASARGLLGPDARHAGRLRDPGRARRLADRAARLEGRADRRRSRRAPRRRPSRCRRRADWAAPEAGRLRLPPRDARPAPSSTTRKPTSSGRSAEMRAARYSGLGRSRS